MKFLIYIAGAILLFSCGMKTGTEKVAGKSGIPEIPEIIGASISKPLISPDRKDTVECKITYSFYATPKFAWQDSVNNAIAKFVWETIEFEEHSTYRYRPVTHKYFYDRLDTFETRYKQYQNEEFMPLWEYEATASIDTSMEDYAQVSQSCYYYTGGAHPNSFSLNTVISKENGQRMLLKDFVTDLKQFNAIAEKYFKKERDLPADYLKSEDFWFEKGFMCNDNFTVGKTGFHFIFNTYEIAPYVYGPTEFTVPMEKVKHLMRK